MLCLVGKKWACFNTIHTICWLVWTIQHKAWENWLVKGDRYRTCDSPLSLSICFSLLFGLPPCVCNLSSFLSSHPQIISSSIFLSFIPSLISLSNNSHNAYLYNFDKMQPESVHKRDGLSCVSCHPWLSLTWLQSFTRRVTWHSNSSHQNFAAAHEREKLTVLHEKVHMND